MAIILSTKRNGGRWGINEKISAVDSEIGHLYILKLDN